MQRGSVSLEVQPCSCRQEPAIASATISIKATSVSVSTHVVLDLAAWIIMFIDHDTKENLAEPYYVGDYIFLFLL